MIPPAAVPPLLHRAALEARLDEIWERRLSVVVAPAGFGKSTVLAAWANSRHCAWCTVDPADHDVARFASGILAALRLRAPRIRPLAPASVLGPEADSDPARRAAALAEQVASTLFEHLHRPVALVLDDVHEIGDDGPANRFLADMIRQAPPELHVVVASRTRVAFPTARLRAKGQVGDVTGADLAFTREETAALVEAVVGVGTREVADRLHELTGGWPAAVRLAADALKPLPADRWPTAVEQAAHPDGPIDGFLVEEVLPRAGPDVVALLVAACLVSSFDADLLEVMAVDQPVAAVAGALRCGLVVVPDAGCPTSYALIPVVRDFARRRLAPAPDRRRSSVWYSWTAAVSGSVTIDTCGSDFDTVLAVYEGSTVGSLSEVAVSNDHPFCNVKSVVTFDAAAGSTYRIAVDGSFSTSIGALGRVELAITAPPANDDRAAAAGLTGPLPLSIFGSTFNASKEAAEPQHAGNPGGRSVWYSWTPGESGEVTVDTCNSGFDTLLAVYVEPSPGSLSGVAANDDACGDGETQSLVTFDAAAGTTYLIAVDGFFSQLANATAFGTFTLRVYGDEAPSLVPHDDFDDAAVLAGPLPITRVGTPSTATAEIGEPDHAAMPGGASVWYSWTAPVRGPVSVDTCGSNFDTLLAIYTGVAVGALTEVASNDNGFGFCLLGSEVDFDAVAGTEYRIAVDGAFGIQGYLYLTVSSNDLAAPDTMIDTGPSGPTLDTAPSFGFSATETGSTFECSLDAAAFAICEPGDSFGPFEPGQHALAVRAVDPAGNIDPTPAIREFEVVLCTISGTPGSDLLIGTAGDDVICGGAGTDIFLAGRGDDIVFAGAGHDLGVAGRGRDRCDGGAGFDLAVGCEVRVDIP